MNVEISDTLELWVPWNSLVYNQSMISGWVPAKSQEEFGPNERSLVWSCEQCFGSKEIHSPEWIFSMTMFVWWGSHYSWNMWIYFSTGWVQPHMDSNSRLLNGSLTWQINSSIPAGVYHESWAIPINLDCSPAAVKWTCPIWVPLKPFCWANLNVQLSFSPIILWHSDRNWWQMKLLMSTRTVTCQSPSYTPPYQTKESNVVQQTGPLAVIICVSSPPLAGENHPR